MALSSWKSLASSLFTAWPTLKQWLDEEHAFLTDAERVRIAYEVWSVARDDQKEGELLYGLLLSRAREWVAKHPQRFRNRDMAPLAEFVGASANVVDAQRDRQQRRDTLIFRGALVSAAVFLAIAIFAGIQYFQADAQRKIAQANSWISQSQVYSRDRNYEMAVNYAKRAFDLIPTAQSRSTFLTALLEVSPHSILVKEIGRDVVEALGWLNDTTLAIASASGRLEGFTPTAGQKRQTIAFTCAAATRARDPSIRTKISKRKRKSHCRRVR